MISKIIYKVLIQEILKNNILTIDTLKSLVDNEESKHLTCYKISDKMITLESNVNDYYVNHYHDIISIYFLVENDALKMYCLLILASILNCNKEYFNIRRLERYINNYDANYFSDKNLSIIKYEAKEMYSLYFGSKTLINITNDIKGLIEIIINFLSLFTSFYLFLIDISFPINCIPLIPLVISVVRHKIKIKK